MRLPLSQRDSLRDCLGGCLLVKGIAYGPVKHTAQLVERAQCTKQYRYTHIFIYSMKSLDTRVMPNYLIRHKCRCHLFIFSALHAIPGVYWRCILLAYCLFFNLCPPFVSL
eukprot:g58456.t1